MALKFNKAKSAILGASYKLSLAYLTPAQIKPLNRKYRGKNKPTNVLAFPYSKNSGEILLCRDVIRKEAKNFDKTPAEFENFLFIHGLLHLKGMEHGSIMERKENFYFQKYFNGQKFNYRNRRGLRQYSGSSRRISKRRTKS